MTAKEKRQRYRVDPVYRATELARTKAANQRSLSSPVYRELTALRKRRYAYHESVDNYRAKIARLQGKLRGMSKRIEELELAWGRERAERKRGERNAYKEQDQTRVRASTESDAGLAGR